MANQIITDNQKSEKGNLKKNAGRIVSRYFSIGIALFAVAVLTAGFFLILKPQYSVISQKHAEAFAAKQSEFEDLKVYYDKLMKYKEAYASISQADKDMVNSILPSLSDREKLFARLGRLISDQGFTLASLTINSTEKKGKPGKPVETKQADTEAVSLSLSIIGTDYRGLKNLLAVIEKNSQLMDIQSVNWSPSSRSVELEVVTYFLEK